MCNLTVFSILTVNNNYIVTIINITIFYCLSTPKIIKPCTHEQPLLFFPKLSISPVLGNHSSAFCPHIFTDSRHFS